MPFEISEAVLRLTAFLGVFIAMALLELFIPKRELTTPKGKRWFTNIMIAGIDSFIVRLMSLVAIPIVAVAAAMYAEVQGWGLFHWTDWPLWLEFLLALILLDLAIYIQHVASHKIPVLWKIHQVHHSDTDIDVTTAIRFHPIEIALSMLYKVVLVFLLGPAVFAVFVFEVILNACAMFNHANISLPRPVDGILRAFIVTPDMHRVHHSIKVRETDSNFGFNLSIWDRIFRTYIPQPDVGHKKMAIGLAQYQSEKPAQLRWSLFLPFLRKSSGQDSGKLPDRKQS